MCWGLSKLLKRFFKATILISQHISQIAIYIFHHKIYLLIKNKLSQIIPFPKI